MKCSFCGTANRDGAITCSVCMGQLAEDSDVAGKSVGESFRRTPQFHPRVQSMIPKPKTMFPTAAGGILIINAVACLCGLLVANAFIREFYPETSNAMTGVNLVIGAASVFVMVGGILAMLRRSWVICLVATIVSFFLTPAFGFLCGITGAMLSLAALALLTQSRGEFSK
jgi:lysylphosphatidylglycerol synthetase-like protein (DUF2156 family)